jgi:hypothetical protein
VLPADTQVQVSPNIALKHGFSDAYQMRMFPEPL